MNRREFTKTLGLTGVAIGLNKSFLSSSSVAPAPQFAVTMDDFGWHNAVHLTAEDRNRAILDVFSANRAKAALFVVGENAEEERGKTILKKRDTPGHIITTHTYPTPPFIP